MPILKIYYDEALNDLVHANRHDLEAGLAQMMRTTLAAEPAKYQVIMCASVHVSPLPVYVDIQFRANDHRSHAVVNQAMQEIARQVGNLLHSGLRIRAFAIDQACLHALDVPASSES